MTDVIRLLDGRLFEPIRRNGRRLVGAEAEFPIVGCGRQMDRAAAMRFLARLRGGFFTTRSFAADGEQLSAADAGRNFIIFDSCYHNVEFVLSPRPGLLELYRSLRAMIRRAADALAEEGFSLLGLGLFPYGGEPSDRLRNAEDDITRRFLGGANFFYNISSEQTHFNCPVEMLPETLSTFARLDFLFAAILANSPSVESGAHCERFFIYKRSPFSKAGLTGCQPDDFDGPGSILEDYAGRALFNRIRGGARELVPLMPMREYFALPEARAEDVDCFDSFRNLEMSPYGTIEFRLPCAQRVSEALVPSALALGLFSNLKEARAMADELYAKLNHPSPSALLEETARGIHAAVAPEALESAARALLDISRRGLLGRGLGEEALLAPLCLRRRLTLNPAAEFLCDVERVGFEAAVKARTNIGEELL